MLYLSDDFEGGAVAFTKLGYTVQPKAGMLVAFPSDERYLHEAQPVISGTRYAIVSWASHLGVAKVRQAAPFASIHFKI